MTDLANFRTAILALLDDAAKTRYSDAQVDQGLRVALQEYSRRRPLLRTWLLDTDGNKRLALPADLNASFITNVELYDTDPVLILSIPYVAYKVDEQWVLDTMEVTYPSGYILRVTYSTTHTVDGLDSASGTTIPAGDESILQIGAAGFTALSRSSSRAETINMQPAVSAQLASLAQGFLSQFRAGLASQAGACFAGPPAMGDVAY